MTDQTMTSERLIALLRQHNGTITHVDGGPLRSTFIAKIPEDRAISPMMFLAVKREVALNLVDTSETEKGKTTRIYRLPG